MSQPAQTAERELARTKDLLASHARMHELIARAAPLEDVLTELVTGIERYDGSVMPCAVLLDPESNTLHPGAGPSLPPEYVAAIDGVVIGPDVGSCGAAAWSGKMMITEDMEEDPKWAPILPLTRAANLRHCWSNPIKAPDGEVLGTLALYGPDARSPQPEHLVLLEDGARVAGIAIERHRAMQRLLHDATHDALTGLLNRRTIFQLVESALEERAPDTDLAVIFVDLDGLKQLNDTLGHDRTDELIGAVGTRLAAAVREDDVVGRFGGDEFIVLARGVNDAEEAAEIGARLLDAISNPLEDVTVTASIGVALVSGPGAPDAREAIRQADSAMYDAKRSGRDRVCFFGEAANSRTGRRVTMTTQIRGAAARGEMHLVFQPLFEIEGGDLLGVEALLRWTHPELGDVSPGEFIPLAEETGAIVPLGAWVLRESCETIAALAAETGRSLELSVNVSAKQLAEPGFAGVVRKTLADTGFPVSDLILEITETAFLSADAATDRTLHDLKALGVRIVLDDFGTGYSSLSWLKRHPLDAIKVDRSFVSGLPEERGDSAIVKAVIGMARAFGRTVTAEGVETESQLQALRDLGCDHAQGFLLGRPVPVDTLRDGLRREAA
jgi:diguanylate cyclase (GGDEF)-like protein